MKLHRAIPIIVLLLCLTVAGFAVAETITEFKTTSDFDTGVKTNTETISDTCTLNSVANRVGLAGIGNYIGVKTGCVSGTKSFATTGLQASYDFQTLRSAKLQDFASTKDCTITNAPTQVAATFGNGYSFASVSSQWMNCVGAAPAGTSWTIFLVVKPTANGGVIINLAPTTGGTFLAYGMNCNQAADAGVFHACTGSNAFDIAGTATINVFHRIAWTKNGPGNLATLYVDGTSVGTSQVANAEEADLNFGRWVAANTKYFDGVIDEASIWNPILTVPQITALSTDGRSSFQTTGNWQSSLQAAPQDHFVQVQLNYTGVSTNFKISSVLLLDNLGNIIFINKTAITAGVSSTYTMDITNQVQWRLQVNFTSTGTGTAYLVRGAVTLGLPPYDWSAVYLAMYASVLVLMLFIANWFRHHVRGED